MIREEELQKLQLAVDKNNIDVDYANKEIRKIKQDIVAMSDMVQNLTIMNQVNNVLHSIDKDVKEINTIFEATNNLISELDDYNGNNVNYLEAIVVRLEQDWANQPQNIDSIY